MKKILTILVVSMVLSASYGALRKDNKTYDAYWISEPTLLGGEFSVQKFRNTFSLKEVPEKLEVRISADNRYKFYVNGKQVAYGPARGDLENWYYETIDIAPYLKKGKNAISALVWHGGTDCTNFAQISWRPAFFLDSVDAKFNYLCSSGRWKVRKSEAYKANMPKAWAFLGSADNLDASKFDKNWTSPDYDDSAWSKPRHLVRGNSATDHVGSYRWVLTKRDIPLLADVQQRFKSIRRCTGINNVPNFISGNAPLTIPANTKCEIVLDNGVLTTAFPRLLVDKGNQAVVRIKYSEALFIKEGIKGNRNEIENKTYEKNTYEDVYKLNGTPSEFIPLWYRAFRYVGLIIETKDEPLVICDFSHNLTRYPFEEKAEFKSSNPRTAEVWDVAWRTIMLCANETYMDCPYYEQLQYVGDTRIQVLVSLYVSGDNRLARKALKLFASSRNADGLTSSRYPTSYPQIIPPFSLYWIQMLHDYAMHCDDHAFVDEMTPTVKSILEWFERQLDSNTGMLKADMPYWNFCDWAMPKDASESLWGIWDGGSAPVDKAKGKGSAIHTLHFATALKDASKIMKRVGQHDMANKYDALSTKLAKNVFEKCWDEKRGLLLDFQDATTSSQHVNILGILSDAIDKSKQADVMTALMQDDNIAQCSLYFRHYLAEALRKVDMGDKYTSQLYPWYAMLDEGLSTFAEKVGNARSDCHAWSASPNYHFLSLVCGIMPSDYGFKKVKISPNLGDLQWVKGKMPHAKGFIEVNFKQVGNGLVGEIILPNGLDGEFEYRGKTQKLSSGKNVINVK